MLYPVRCCCEPLKLYGYLELPEGLRDGAVTRARERPTINAGAGFAGSPGEPTITILRDHAVTLKRVRGVDEYSGERIDEIAVYSDDRPIEFWRTIQGFREIKPKPFTFKTTDPFLVDMCKTFLVRGELYRGPNFRNGRCVGKVIAVEYDEREVLTVITIAEMVMG